MHVPQRAAGFFFAALRFFAFFAFFFAMVRPFLLPSPNSAQADTPAATSRRRASATLMPSALATTRRSWPELRGVATTIRRGR